MTATVVRQYLTGAEDITLLDTANEYERAVRLGLFADDPTMVVFLSDVASTGRHELAVRAARKRRCVLT